MFQHIDHIEFYVDDRRALHYDPPSSERRAFVARPVVVVS